MENLKIDYNNMTAEAVGYEQGIPEATFRARAPFMNAAFDRVAAARGKGWQEWMELPFSEKSEVARIIEAARHFKKTYDNFVVFGIGGSALGPMAVASALLHLRHNELKRSVRKAPRLYVEDNVDPERMAALLDVIDVKKTVFNVVTKSGETSETLSQFLIILDVLQKTLGGDKLKEHIVVTTTEGKGSLYEIAAARGFKIFGVGKGVGGRFSVFSPVGLLPLASVGIDIRKLLRGAADMSKACLKRKPSANPALLAAFLQYHSMTNGKNISVMMPYADGLKYIADFYCQLWGESLGKARDDDGKEVYAGQTPVKALGVTDQHSQIQLYTEGPFDKVVTFVGVEKFRKEVLIPAAPGMGKTEFLQNRTLNELLNAEREATAFALTKAHRPNFTILLPEINEYYIGQLLTLMMYQTAFAGAMLNIDAYNQPGVEEGKLATFAMLGRDGYAEKLKEIKGAFKSDKFVL